MGANWLGRPGQPLREVDGSIPLSAAILGAYSRLVAGARLLSAVEVCSLTGSIPVRSANNLDRLYRFIVEYTYTANLSGPDWFSDSESSLRGRKNWQK